MYEKKFMKKLLCVMLVACMLMVTSCQKTEKVSAILPAETGFFNVKWGISMSALLKQLNLEESDIWTSTREMENHTIHQVIPKEKREYFGKMAYVQYRFSEYPSWKKAEIGLTGVDLFYVAGGETQNQLLDQVTASLKETYPVWQSQEVLASVAEQVPAVKEFYEQNIAEDGWTAIGSRMPYYLITAQQQNVDIQDSWTNLKALSVEEKLFVVPDLIVAFDGLFPAILSQER